MVLGDTRSHDRVTFLTQPLVANRAKKTRAKVVQHPPTIAGRLIALSMLGVGLISWNSKGRLTRRAPPKRRMRMRVRTCLHESAGGEYSGAHLSGVRAYASPTSDCGSLIA